MKTEPNAPINPTIWDDKHNPAFVRDNDGLTKREYFAAMVMQGLLASNGIDNSAIMSVRAADALIDALNQTK